MFLQFMIYSETAVHKITHEKTAMKNFAKFLWITVNWSTAFNFIKWETPSQVNYFRNNFFVENLRSTISEYCANGANKDIKNFVEKTKEG